MLRVFSVLFIIALAFCNRADAQSRVSILEKECIGNNYSSCEDAGSAFLFEMDGARFDNIKALELFLKACNGGVYLSCVYSAMLYKKTDPTLSAGVMPPFLALVRSGVKQRASISAWA